MIRRYNDFLNESLIQDNLINKLLNIGGNNVILGRDTENEIRRMIDDGRLFDDDIVYLPGQNSRCHANVADRSKRTKGFNIVSGYALINDTWFCHSWGYNKYKKCIFETTSNKYIKYYGYELNKVETLEFIYSN